MKPVALELLKQARALYNNNRELCLQRAVEALNADPNCAEATYLVATCLLGKGWHGLAINCFFQARAGLPNSHEIQNNLGISLRKLGLDDAAESAWREGHRLMKKSGVEDADVYNNLATICVNAAREKEAEEYARQAIALDPNHIPAQWNLCLALLEQGRFREGWKQHRFGYMNGLRVNKQYDCGPWTGRKVKRLVVFGEQGQGDEIMFASLIPEARKRCDELIIDCHPRLERLFRRSFDALRVHPTRKSLDTQWIYQDYPIDAKCSMGDLPGIFRNSVKSFDGAKKYLKTNPSFTTALRRRTDMVARGRKKIGICWEGGTLDTHVFRRTPDFAFFRHLIKAHPQAAWFSCHYKSGSDKFLASQGLPVEHWQEVIDDFDALTSLIGVMDLLITVDQTAVHQAGAIGQECWVLTPHKCSYRYCPRSTGERMLWYGDHVKLIRQADDGEWDSVFQRLHEKLQAFLEDTPHVDKSGIQGEPSPIPPGSVRLWNHGPQIRQFGA